MKKSATIFSILVIFRIFLVVEMQTVVLLISISLRFFYQFHNTSESQSYNNATTTAFVSLGRLFLSTKRLPGPVVNQVDLPESRQISGPNL